MSIIKVFGCPILFSIGDIIVGFIPFGDARDVALQEWYYAEKVLDENGEPKYDETILYLSYMGLGSDALQITPALPLGVALNTAFAVIKPAFKQLGKISAKKVFGAKFKEMAIAAKNRDWTRFEALARNMLPIIELLAVVVVDEELRDLLFGAIRNTTDLDNWTEYLRGFGAQAGGLVYHSPLPSYLFDEAYAATSGFKLVLQELRDYATRHAINDAGGVLADSIGGLAKAISNNSAIAAHAYKTDVIKAVMHIHALGGQAAIDKLANFKHISQGVVSATEDIFDKRIEKLMKNLAELDLSLLPMSRGSGEGFSRIFGDLSRSNSFAKGAAHAINVLNRIQKGEVTGLSDLGVLTGIEKTRDTIINGIKVRSGREDFIFGNTILELKSYNLSNLRSNLIRDIKGKANDKGEQIGLQLFTNVLEIAEGKDIRMVFEKFDGIDAAMVRNTLDEVVTNALKTNPELRKLIAGWYEKSDIELDKHIEKNILKKFRAKLNSQVLVVE